MTTNYALIAFLCGMAMPLAAAAVSLGKSKTTLRRMLRESDRGCLVVAGRQTTIAYRQGGRQGQGKILIDESEVERLKELESVSPAGGQQAQRATNAKPSHLAGQSGYVQA